VAKDEQHNSSEEAGGHFPFLHFEAALDSAREIQARLNTQGIHSKLKREQSYRLTTAEPEEHSANCA